MHTAQQLFLGLIAPGTRENISIQAFTLCLLYFGRVTQCLFQSYWSILSANFLTSDQFGSQSSSDICAYLAKLFSLTFTSCNLNRDFLYKAIGSVFLNHSTSEGKNKYGYKTEKACINYFNKKSQCLQSSLVDKILIASILLGTGQCYILLTSSQPSPSLSKTGLSWPYFQLVQPPTPTPPHPHQEKFNLANI